MPCAWPWGRAQNVVLFSGAVRDGNRICHVRLAAVECKEGDVPTQGAALMSVAQSFCMRAVRHFFSCTSQPIPCDVA
jgi:hypothetical protein